MQTPLSTPQQPLFPRDTIQIQHVFSSLREYQVNAVTSQLGNWSSTQMLQNSKGFIESWECCVQQKGKSLKLVNH
ncbi:hypothetical protein SprV_0100197800 [Sparganum proliferum]